MNFEKEFNLNQFWCLNKLIKKGMNIKRIKNIKKIFQL